ncbi:MULTISPECIES: hypothetical protein [Pseudanabaena]|uniref:Uncharacterized protein n=2 Tax=Pseudanabaena TaxID=1152 RepID=L8MXS5_9CYAN|nr:MULTISPECIES: hypothetical protein [Pseudanabaena]ELS32802.1 hypothetical protein Pse7429DRAFT_2007 [Pseudanabaena biceps PCC 7429]MDG3494990.1 hypothetical protein [Pseudanabaena catenata USMAC16]
MIDTEQEFRRTISQIESFLSEHSELQIYYILGYYLVLVDDPTQTYGTRKIFESCLEEKVLKFLQEDYVAN